MGSRYAVAERCIVVGSPDDADGLENDPEPVVCIAMGIWADEAKAQGKADELNAGDDAPEGGRRFEVVALAEQDGRTMGGQNQ